MPTNIGLVFDFDDTLAPDSTTYLLEREGVDAERFWSEEFQSRVQAGYEPTVAYLSVLLDKVGESGPLGELTISDLDSLGDELSDELYPGIPEIFDDVEDIVNDYEDVAIEYYIISEGLKPVIQGTDIADRCEAIYASEVNAGANEVLEGIECPVSFTDKTRYLYEINKGISPDTAQENPYAVNEEIDPENRAVPFENMIYIGDGITDIPCFSLVNDRGGRVFGVTSAEERSAKQQAIIDIGSPIRAGNLNVPEYGEDGRLGSLLRLTIEGLCTDRTIEELEAL
jgi:2-hydroxy-3-keto-5-methylthiopentenyl-1-phosphate phosphatase